MVKKQAEQWAKGIVNNFARQPDGGDRDQAKAIAAGTGDVAIMNTYYVGLLQILKILKKEKWQIALESFSRTKKQMVHM